MSRDLPLIIGNIASSLDGKIAPYDRSRMTISCQDDFDLRDAVRAKVDAVLIGGNTLVCDSPSLRLKSQVLIEERIALGLTPQPAGVAVCGRTVPDEDNAFFKAVDSRRILICGNDFHKDLPNCEIIKHNTLRPDISKAMKQLFESGIYTILVEGGGSIMFEFLRLGLMKEIYVSIHPIIIGGSNSPTIVDGQGFGSEDVKRLAVVETFPLSDGGITYHCVIEGCEPITNYRNKQFNIRRNQL